MSEPMAVAKQSPTHLRITYEQLIGMGLHEYFKLGLMQSVMRVPGGWIYSRWDAEGRTATTFVPMCTDDFGRADPKDYRRGPPQGHWAYSDSKA